MEGDNEDYDDGTAAANCCAHVSINTSQCEREASADNDADTLVRQFMAFPLGPMYHQCEFVASLSSLTPINASTDTLNGGLFRRFDLGYTITRKAALLHVRVSRNRSCLKAFRVIVSYVWLHRRQLNYSDVEIEARRLNGALADN